MRDIGVEQFKRPGGTLLGAGHVRPGSAFDTLGSKKKEVPKKRKEMEREYWEIMGLDSNEFMEEESDDDDEYLGD